MATEHCSECEADKGCGNDHLYVVELDAAAFPSHKEGTVKGYLYVGQTGKTVMERFDDNFRREDGAHIARDDVDTFGEDGGWKYNSPSPKLIRKHYVTHRPDLYAEKNPIAYDKNDNGKTERWEANLADKLRKRNWHVKGPTRNERHAHDE
jgi:hypothetical protein